MQYRKLGKLCYNLGVIGFGTWQLGGERWEDISDKESTRLLQEANDLGVNVYDVAVVYGQYEDTQGYIQCKAQERLGRAFADRRDKVVYCLKLGQYDEYTHRYDYEPKRIVDQFKHSLRRLKTDYIDICLVHAPSLQAIKDQRAISVMQTLQAQGHVKAVGYSFEAEPEHVAIAVSQKIDAIMLQYNLLDTECADAIELARIYGIGILVGGPFKRGYLTGKYRSVKDFSRKDDYWDLNIKMNPGKVEQVLDSVNKLLKQHKSPEKLREAALRHILKQPGVSSCIVGHRSIKEVIENIKATDTMSADSPSIPAIEKMLFEKRMEKAESVN